jgi:hypothetical protein
LESPIFRFAKIYSPSPEYPAACCRDERQRGPAFNLSNFCGLGYGEFRFDTPQLAAGSFIIKNVLMAAQRDSPLAKSPSKDDK